MSFERHVATLHAGELDVWVGRGYLSDQFARNCYAFVVGTCIAGGDERRSYWEVDRSTGRMRHLGWQWQSEVVAYLAGELKAVAERFDP